MDSQPLLPKQIKIDDVTFGVLKALESGGKSVPVGLNGKPLIIQTPEMTVPFGMSKWNADKSEKDKYTLELSFKNRETNKAQQNFFEFLKQFDQRFIEEGFNNSTLWFKKKYNTKDVVEALYTHMLKFPKDKETGEITDKYPPTFRVNLPQKDGKFAFQVYNKNKELIDITDIEKGSKVTVIMQCLGGWIAGGKFGCSWKPIQMLVQPPASIKGFAFRQVDEDDDDIDIDSAPTHTPKTNNDGDEDNGDVYNAPIPDQDVEQEQDSEPAKDDHIIESSSSEDEDDAIDGKVTKVTKKRVAKKSSK